jgi:hypothetical protein
VLLAQVAELLALEAGSVTFADLANGGPVLLLWSENAPAAAYAAAKAALGGACTVVARNPRAFAASEGNFAWVLPAREPTAEQLGSSWGQQYLADFEWGMANNQAAASDLDPAAFNRLAVGAVYPGFDDSSVPAEWNGGTARQIARHVSDGTTYELTWELALGYTPQRQGGPTAVEMPWVQIITWNDFPEGTSIEPSAGEGGADAYAATRDFVRRWHGGESAAPEASGLALQAVEAAVAILAAHRGRAPDAMADGTDDGTAAAVGRFLDGEFAAAISLLREAGGGTGGTGGGGACSPEKTASCAGVGQVCQATPGTPEGACADVPATGGTGGGGTGGGGDHAGQCAAHDGGVACDFVELVRLTGGVLGGGGGGGAGDLGRMYCACQAQLDAAAAQGEGFCDGGV